MSGKWLSRRPAGGTFLREPRLGLVERLAEAAIVPVLRLFRLIPIHPFSAFAGRLGRLVGPLHRRSRVGLDNLRHAFPEKTETERRAILRAMWDHLFRLGVEYIQIDKVLAFDPSNPEAGRVQVSGTERFIKLRDDGLPGLIFTAHLGNWELLAVGAARYGLDAASLYRAPNVGIIAGLLGRARRRAMHSLVQSRPGAAYDLMSVLERGGHVGLLVDQKFTRRNRVATEFFGRPAGTSPLLAQLARRYDCPVHGAFAVRLPGGRFRVELTEEITLPRDADGAIDVEAATQRITAVVEDWVREYPAQWLWIHRRWDM